MNSRAPLYVATALAMATIIYAIAIAKARAETQTPTYLLIGTSTNPKSTQTITIVKYPSELQCDQAVKLMVIRDTGKKNVIVTMKPFCDEVKPKYWVD